MCESARTKLGVAWSRAGSEARLCKVPMAAQVVHGQYGEGSNGEVCWGSSDGANYSASAATYCR